MSLVPMVELTSPCQGQPAAPLPIYCIPRYLPDLTQIPAHGSLNHFAGRRAIRRFEFLSIVSVQLLSAQECANARCVLHFGTLQDYKRNDFPTGDTELNEAPCNSLLRRSSHFRYEGRKLQGILRNSPKPLPFFAKAREGSPRFHPCSKLRGIRRRRIKERA